MPTSKTPVRVTVTGAAGQIGYSLLYRIASGEMLGKDQPVILQLLEVTPALQALKGVMMELDDCAFPLLKEIIGTDDAKVAFKDTEIALLVGARPRSKGMERKDLLEANAQIFTAQGKAMNEVANKNVKVLVVGNRALSQLSAKTKAPVGEIQKLVVWGNHSPTMYPDYRFADVNGKSLKTMVNDETWYKETFIPTVGKRGAAIIEARGLSSAASAANAAIDHIHDWWMGTQGKWVTMGVPSDGSYGIPEGIIYGFPCTCENKEYKIVKGLEIDSFSKEKMEFTLKELLEERDGVKHLLG